VRPTSMGDVPAQLLDRPAPEVARWLGLVRLHDLITARHRLEDHDDTEALHDFRVALRRLRSLLRAYREVLADSVTRKTRRRLGRLTTAAGMSRDSEVRLQWLREHVQTNPGDALGVEWVERELDRDRNRGDRQLERVLNRNFATLTEGLQQSLQRYRVTYALGEAPELLPARKLVSQTLHAMAITLQETLEMPHTIGDGDVLHRARIAVKRLRYMLEPLVEGECAPTRVLRTAAAAITRLERLQDELGKLRDLLTFDHWLADRIAEEAAQRARDREALDAPPGTEDQLVGHARDPALTVFALGLRRRLHKQAARQYRFLDSDRCRRPMVRLIRRIHAVADGVARRRSAPDRPPPSGETERDAGSA
jgi:CHAD domain-containing protein